MFQRKSIEMQQLMTPEGGILVTFRSGVAEAVKETEETLDQLLNKADQALYSAKREGRNQVRVYA